MNYFIEFKNRLIFLLLTWLSTMLVTYFYKETFFFIMVQPNILNSSKEQLTFFYFIFTDVMEVLSIYLLLVKFLSFQIFIMFAVYHFFIFIIPGFFQLEYLNFKFIIQILVLTWFISILLVNYLLVPLTWKFFLSFQNLTISYSFFLHFEAKLKEYFYFYISFYYLCGFYCQCFMLFLLILNYFRINIKTIKKLRKIFYYCFIVFATLISPPEIWTQIWASLMVVLIYEFLLLCFLFKTQLSLLTGYIK